MIDTYDKFWDAVQKIEKTIKSCKTIAQIENCKQWMDNVWDDNLLQYKGIIAENYVATQLVVNNIPLIYWESGNQAEVDFILYNDDGIIPIEVKANDNVGSQSLNVYMKRYQPKYAIRISTKNFGFDNNIKSIPLYATFCIE